MLHVRHKDLVRLFVQVPRLPTRRLAAFFYSKATHDTGTQGAAGRCLGGSFVAGRRRRQETIGPQGLRFTGRGERNGTQADDAGDKADIDERAPPSRV